MPDFTPEQLQAIREQMERDIEPKLAEFVEKHLDEFHAAMQPVAAVVLQVAEDAARILEPVARAAQELIEPLSKITMGLAKAFETLPERTRVSLLVLARHGWFVSPTFSLGSQFDIQRLFEADDTTPGHDWMMEAYERDLDGILAFVAERFPHRSPLVAKAIDAHRRGDYELSVPVFLAQADGITYEILDVSLYGKHRGNRVPRTREKVDDLGADPLWSAMMEPFREALPIADGPPERAIRPPSLNRHTVLHGVETGYGTRLYSLQALSLLAYVAWILVRSELPTPAAQHDDED